MGFSVVGGSDQCNRLIPCGTDGSSTYYVGQIVAITQASIAVATGGAVVPLAVPAGVADLTNKQTVFGIVGGMNDRSPTVDSTYGQKIVGVTTIASLAARTSVFNGGMYSIADSQPLVFVTPLHGDTLIEGPLFNATNGVVPTLLTATVASSDGCITAPTTNACDFTPAANLATIYCRTGANAGIYRKTSDTSTTAPTTTIAFPKAIAVGDTFIRVPLAQGISYGYIAGPGMFFDCSKPPATNYFTLIVEKLALEVSGQERAQFRFTPIHFSMNDSRAAN